MVDEFVQLENEELKFHASINGVTLSDTPKEKEEAVNTSDAKVPLFGDPEAYTNLSEEEKQSITEKMKNKHQTWTSDMKVN